MATKKQKREKAMRKREEFLAEQKANGLKALEADRNYRKAEKERFHQLGREINARYERILDNARRLNPQLHDEAVMDHYLELSEERYY